MLTPKTKFFQDDSSAAGSQAET